MYSIAIIKYSINLYFKLKKYLFKNINILIMYKMKSINIINNSDQKNIFHNMLITNQYKLLNLYINIFEFGYLNIKKIPIVDIKDYLYMQHFINLELFIYLINLELKFYNPNTKTKMNSLEYLIKTKSYKLIEFILDLESEYKSNLINWKKYYSDKNILEYMFKKLYQNDIVINKIIDLIINLNYSNNIFKNNDSNKKSSIFYIVSKCSESIIIRLLELNLIKIFWIDNNSNNLIHWACKRNLINLFNWLINENRNIDINIYLNSLNSENRTPLHLACINNNINFVKIMIDKKVKLELKDNYYNYSLNYAIKYGNSELVKLLLEQDFDLINIKSNIFYQMIQYQNENMIKYFIDNNYIDINKTNLIWTLLLYGSKKYYSEMYSYGNKKIKILIQNFINDLCNSYDYDNTNYFRM